MDAEITLALPGFDVASFRAWLSGVNSENVFFCPGFTKLESPVLGSTKTLIVDGELHVATTMDVLEALLEDEELGKDSIAKGKEKETPCQEKPVDEPKTAAPTPPPPPPPPAPPVNTPVVAETAKPKEAVVPPVEGSKKNGSDGPSNLNQQNGKGKTAQERKAAKAKAKKQRQAANAARRASPTVPATVAEPVRGTSNGSSPTGS